MYHNLGVNWASTLVAFLALICAPLPMYVRLDIGQDNSTDRFSLSLFYVYGAKIRVMTKFGREADELGQKMKMFAQMQQKPQV